MSEISPQAKIARSCSARSRLLFPMFSPDGQRLAYFGRSDYAVAIFTIGIDGSDPRQLTGGRELNHQPRWGSDGREVFFFQGAPTVSFRRVSALGGPSTEFRPWSWDREFAPYFDPTGRVHRISPSTRRPALQRTSRSTRSFTKCRARRKPSGPAAPRPSADGRPMVHRWWAGSATRRPAGRLVMICRVADAELSGGHDRILTEVVAARRLPLLHAASRPEARRSSGRSRLTEPASVESRTLAHFVRLMCSSMCRATGSWPGRRFAPETISSGRHRSSNAPTSIRSGASAVFTVAPDGLRVDDPRDAEDVVDAGRQRDRQ